MLCSHVLCHHLQVQRLQRFATYGYLKQVVLKMIAADLADSMDADKLSEDQSEAVSMVTALRSPAPALPELPCLAGNCAPCFTLDLGLPCLAQCLSADNKCCECRELFKSLDTDASNTIEAKELADGLKAQGYNISQQELAQLMGRVDFDRNGTLDLEEFISGLIDWTEVSLTACGSV